MQRVYYVTASRRGAFGASGTAASAQVRARRDHAFGYPVEHFMERSLISAFFFWHIHHQN
jgi:hypothetical protein